MSQLKFKYDKAQAFFHEHELDYLAPAVKTAHEQLSRGEGPGHEYTDWLDWPETFDLSERNKIEEIAQEIQDKSEVLLVIGIGGSYLGARAAIEFLYGPFYNAKKGLKGETQIYFVGNNISATYIQDVMAIVGDRDFSINVISKSGTTTEPAIAFRIFKEKLIEKYGTEEAARRIIVTTDEHKGALKKEADLMGYQTLVIPAGIGGRFSVLTAVGLLPIAVAGGNIELLLQGAQEAMRQYSAPELNNNEAYQYAAMRHIFQQKGKEIEILANYEPNLQAISEWWKQLYGESEGKDGKGIFPAAANFSTDLHSLGQIIQDGKRNLFETVIHIQDTGVDFPIPSLDQDADGLKYIEGKQITAINDRAMEGTLLAHTDGGVPNLLIELKDLSERSLGHLIYFFEKAVAISGYLSGVNPFDQPGVEAYKQNMFALLGKKGYEKLNEQLLSRLRK